MVNLLVGKEAIRIELPKAFLSRHSVFFKTAFDVSGRFSEAISQEMSLPEEDPRDLLILIRFLIEAPSNLNDLVDSHWPFRCTSDEDGSHDSDCCDYSYLRTDRIPPMLRLCAMVERLGFEFPEDRYWPVLKASVGSPGQPTNPIAPPIIEWAMDRALDGGHFQRYIALLLSQIVRSGGTSLDTYLPILHKYPGLAEGILQATYRDKTGIQFEWDESEGAWKDLHGVIMRTQ